MKLFWAITLVLEAASVIGFALYAKQHDWLFIKEFGESGKLMLLVLAGCCVAFDAVAGLVCLIVLAARHS